MEKFVDKTESLNEPAIKTGNFVPREAVNLSWFSSKPISPENNIVTTDLSSLISENITEFKDTEKIMFANELGYLEDLNGNSYLDFDQIYISDVTLNEALVSGRYTVEELSSKTYAMTYYVSRYFVLTNNSYYPDTSLSAFTEEKYIPKNIKVLDSNGNHYVDDETGRKKYRIELESFIGDPNYQLTEIPNRIIAFLEDVDTNGFTLVYDKVECDSLGRWSKQVLKYKETINAKPIFKRVQEEAEVIDPYNSENQIYSVKRNTKDKKINTSYYGSYANQVIVDKKGVEDNRDFQIFNWRIVGKVKSSVNLNEINYGNDLENPSVRVNNIKVGVLYSSFVSGTEITEELIKNAKPYVFYNLENSPFNLTGMKFVNPNSSTEDKSLANYWLVDIDTIDQNKISNYDVLVCSLHWKLTADQALKINKLNESYGSILIDTFSAPDNSLTNLDNSFVESSFTAEITNETYNSSSRFNSSALNNGFTLAKSRYAQDCGIYGYGKNLESFKKYKFFNSSSLDSILSIGGNKVFASKRVISSGDSHRASNVVLSTTGFLNYANALFPTVDNLPENNFRIQPIGVLAQDTGSTSPYSEGPLQFLYNFVAVALNDKIESTRISQDLTSNIHYFITSWKNNWVIDSNALFEDELNEYFSYRTVNGEIIAVRDIVENPKISYIDEIQKIIPTLRAVFLDQNDFNLDLFIEYTNPNISWTNSQLPSASELSEISSLYNVVKVAQKDSQCSVYSNIACKPFEVPSNFGSYVIKDKSKTSDDQIDNIYKTPIEMGSVSQIKNYNFNPILTHSKTVLEDGPKYFDAQVELEASVIFKQIKFYDELVDNKDDPIFGPPRPQPNIPGTTGEFSSTNHETTQEYPSIKGLNSISNPLNVFSYTYDMGQGNTFAQYKNGSKGDYVRYIQYTLIAAGLGGTVDGDFGPKTEERVRQFQRNNGIFVDGVVDSQTKMYLGLLWSGLADSNLNLYTFVLNSQPTAKVRDYIEAARKTRTAQASLNTQQPTRLLNFTGISGASDPSSAEIWIGFKLVDDSDIVSIGKPPTIEKIISVTINPLSEFSSKATSYSGIEVLDWSIGSSFNTSGSSTAGGGNRALPRSTSPITISINSAQAKGKWISIKIKGSSLGGKFGPNCEGIGIQNISFKYKTTDTAQADLPGLFIGYNKKLVNREISKDVVGKVSLYVNFNSLSATPVTRLIDKNLILSSGTLKQITLFKEVGNEITTKEDFYDDLDYSLKNVNLVGIPGSLPTLPFKQTTDLTDPRKIVITNIQLNTTNSPKESGNVFSQIFPSSYIDLTNTENSLTAKVSRVPYVNPDNYFFSKQIDNYYLKSAITGEIKNKTNTVNFYDGPMLMCEEDGSPYTIDLSSISSSISGSISNSDIEFHNTIEQPGLHNGFYDNTSKTFIGKRVSFLKYINNVENIYPAVYAYDYDGNLGSAIDFDGLNQSNLSPVTIPTKVAYPVFKIALNKTNKIQLLEMQKGLDKTEPWPIQVSSGSFLKEINVSEIFRPRGFLVNYSDQILLANYDTSIINSVPSSKIYGRGYLDIIDETPIVIDSLSIKTKHYPIHFVHKKPKDLLRFATPFTYVVKVYTREDVDSPWVEIDNSLIRDIDSSTGVIKFTSPIISSDPELIKVNYTVKLNGIPVKHSAGIPIPTNPFLNKDTLRINKPLYIYILPKEVYKILEVSIDFKASRKLVEEYSYESIVNFTYDNNIFNKYDTYNYNPFALLIGIVYCINNFRDEDFSVTDLRVKGGGVSANFDTNTVIRDIEESISYWDVYPPMAEAYPKGGYVIVKIPSSVKKNFTNPDEVYTIVRNNLTAGVVFDIQDMDGKDWGSSVTSSS
jgi:hypothetical protein